MFVFSETTAGGRRCKLKRNTLDINLLCQIRHPVLLGGLSEKTRISKDCHFERSEKSHLSANKHEILRYAQDDNLSYDS